jgi:hypothetical protein
LTHPERACHGTVLALLLAVRKRIFTTEESKLMALLKKSALVMVMMLTAGMGMAFGQLKKQVQFDIDVTFALRMGDYLLPPGHYVINQVDDND